MGLKKYKPRTATQRFKQSVTTDHLSKYKPFKGLLTNLKTSSGRNNQGQITVRHKGGRIKRSYREIDFKVSLLNVPGVIKTIEYDPNRSANISLVFFSNGVKKYVLSPKGAKVNDPIQFGDNSPIKTGNRLRLANIPTGSTIHNIELHKGRGGQLVRSAGTAAVLNAKGPKYANIKLPSGEVRLISIDCYASIGQVGNIDHRNARRGKAGITRKLGIRPTVRGSVMNAADHPHGGGEGRAPIGRKGPLSPWGKPTLGKKTRNPKNKSNNLILSKRGRR